MKKKSVVLVVLFALMMVGWGRMVMGQQKVLGHLRFIEQNGPIRQGDSLLFNGTVVAEEAAVYWAPRLIIVGRGLRHWDKVLEWSWTQPREVTNYEFYVPITEFMFDELYRWYFHPLTRFGIEGFASPEGTFEIEEFAPKEYRLYQNFPNPFNFSTIIHYALTKTAFVELKVFNLLGEETTTLISETMPAGGGEVRWNADGLANGVYFYTIKVGRDFCQTRKMVILK